MSSNRAGFIAGLITIALMAGIFIIVEQEPEVPEVTFNDDVDTGLAEGEFDFNDSVFICHGEEWKRLEDMMTEELLELVEILTTPGGYNYEDYKYICTDEGLDAILAEEKLDEK